MKNIGLTIHTETGDLNVKAIRDSLGMITSGLVVGDIQKQNQALIIYMQPGELKEQPQTGVGISSMLLSSDTLLYKHKIREQLEADGFRVNHLEIAGNNGELNIELNASY